MCPCAPGQAPLGVQGKRNRMDSRVASRGGPSLPSPSLCSRSVQRWGQKSSVLFFSRYLELTRVPMGRSTPRLPAVEAPGAGATSGLRAACRPAGRLSAAATLGGVTRKGFSDRNPNGWCQGCFPPSFRYFFLEILSQLKHTCLVPLPPPKFTQMLRTRSQLGGLVLPLRPGCQAPNRVCVDSRQGALAVRGIAALIGSGRNRAEV